MTMTLTTMTMTMTLMIILVTIMIVTPAKQGLDMSLCDYDGRTALHLAAAEGQLPCVEVKTTTIIFVII